MNETNFYVQIKNHFNQSDMEKNLARQEELDTILGDIEALEFNDFASEDWELIY